MPVQHPSASVENQENPSATNQSASSPVQNQTHVQHPSPSSEIEVERDPAKRKKIVDWPLELRDQVRRKYLLHKAYQPRLSYHKPREIGGRLRRFQEAWYAEFTYLEYSPTTHKAYCFPCFLFRDMIHEKKASALVQDGFDNWKRVHGKDCVFLNHVGSSSSSIHNKCVASAYALMKPSNHIDKVIQRISREDVAKHRLRLKTTIMVVQELALQGSSFRGHDESDTSLNQGNVKSWIGFAAKLNEGIKNVVLDKAPGNAKYTSPNIQKEILAIIANIVRGRIRDEIGNSCYSILVDEAVDQAGREQMSIILRFVNSRGILTERFFALKSVPETSADTLKQVICGVLSKYNLQIDKMRGQGYDGASNMSGKFNGLRALFLRDCPYAYFVHCFAHKLQLTLVASAKACDPVWDFFSLLDCIINIVKSSPKRIMELQAIHKRDIDGMLKSGEIQSGQGANQMRSLTRAGQTRWHSHYHSVLSIIDMFHATCEVLRDISENCKEGPARAQARGAYQKIETFEFVFHLHLMKAFMEITNFLCQAFQQESVDIVAALGYVSSVKAQLQQLRDEGWGTLLEEVRSFCSKHDIEVLELNDTIGRGANRTTVEQRYHFDIFN
ncbi:Zinc finger MYM-type protein 1 [Linum perenne]